MIRRVVHASGQGRPLAIDTNPRIAKLVFLDVGLMHASLQIDAQLVQEPALYFWAREALNSQVVVDYLIAVGGAVLPIEVKSGASGTLKSLNIILDSHPKSTQGIRLYMGIPLPEARILHLPLYAAGSLCKQHN